MAETKKTTKTAAKTERKPGEFANPVRIAKVTIKVEGPKESIAQFEAKFVGNEKSKVVGKRLSNGTYELSYTGRGAAKQDVLRRVETATRKDEKLSYTVVEHSATVVA